MGAGSTIAAIIVVFIVLGTLVYFLNKYIYKPYKCSSIDGSKLNILTFSLDSNGVCTPNTCVSGYGADASGKPVNSTVGGDIFTCPVYWVKTPGVDFPGNVSLGAATTEDSDGCIQQCKSKTGCIAAIYNGKLNACYFKTALTSRTLNSNVMTLSPSTLKLP